MDDKKPNLSYYDNKKRTETKSKHELEIDTNVVVLNNINHG